MSLTSLIGVKNRGLVFLLSFAESILFFGVSAGVFALADAKSPPAWGWVVLVVVYLAVVAVYWAPAREDAVNRMEVWGFGTALVIALACCAAVLQSHLGKVVAQAS